jgi:hypothetical protein
MTTLYSDLSPAQKLFVDRVEAGLRNMAKDKAVVAVYGDGTSLDSPNGEKFAARKIGASFEVVFDFPMPGGWFCYHTAVQLPLNA